MEPASREHAALYFLSKAAARRERGTVKGEATPSPYTPPHQVGGLPESAMFGSVCPFKELKHLHVIRGFPQFYSSKSFHIFVKSQIWSFTVVVSGRGQAFMVIMRLIL